MKIYRCPECGLRLMLADDDQRALAPVKPRCERCGTPAELVTKPISSS